MSQQLQITGGAKVRDLNDVIIGTSGVLSSLAFNVANGVPKLDSNAKILVSQLPNSVMEYKGTWDASTNTPTLVNGVGNAGDVYLCNVAGTVDFGAGPISFVVSDQVIYSGSIWQKASGSNGTVTSIGLSSTGNDAITITGSPVTTSGTINLGFAGTNLQYINGAGDLTTFPTLLSSVGLSMPSAFNVSNSPLTANGTIAVTGAGYPSQYIRGDGTLADFPTSGGGGSSVSYYLNGGTSQGTIGGVTYYEMSKTADTGTGVDFPLVGNGLIVSFLTDAGDPAQLNIPAGNWDYEIYASMSSNGGTPQLYAELYVYDGTTFTLISTSSNEILYDGVNLNLYTFAMAVPATTLALTDRLAVKLYATNSGGKTTTVHTQDSHLCQVITTFSTGITALNGLTAQIQYFATGTSGTDFNISSATATHTFNLPVASAANTGKLSSTDWSTFNGKVPYTGAIANVDLGIYSITAGIGTFTNGVLNGNGTNPANLYLKKGSSPFFTNAANYGLIAAVSSSFILISDVDGTNYKYASFDLGSLTNNTNRAYTLPDASGTLAILEAGTQTFTGTVNVLGSLGTKYGISIEKGNTPSPLSFNDIFIYASSGATSIINFANSSYITSFSFPTSNQTFTYPAATGTIALTSDLSGFVTSVTGTSPIVSSGGTTPAISIPVATTSVNGYLSSADWTTFNSKQGTITLTTTGSSGVSTFSSNTLNIPDYGSALSGYLPLTGGTLTGILNSNSLIYTSLNFKTDSSVAFKNISSGGTAPSSLAGYSQLFFDTYQLTIRKADNQIIYLRYPNSATTQTWDLNVEGYIAVQYLASQTTGGVSFVRSTGQFTQDATNFFWDDTNNRLGINTSTPLSPLQVVIGSGSGTVARFGEASGTTGKQLLIGVDTATGRSEIQSVHQGTSATPLALNPSSGSVLIGTTTDSGYRLDVNGTLRATGALTGTSATFSSSVTGGYIQSNYVSGSLPAQFRLYDGNGGTNAKNWWIETRGTSGADKWFTIGSVNDALTDLTYGMRIHATNYAVDKVIFDSGNVGINNTGNSAVKLGVTGADTTSSAYSFIAYDSTANALLALRNDGLIFTGTRTNSPYNYSTTGRSAILDSGGNFGYLLSTRESKANIEPIKNIDFINQLNPVSFNYRKKDNKINEFTNEVYDNVTYGFIADEVEKVNKELVFYNEDGSLAGVEYNSMIAILTKAVQELQEQINELKNK